MKALLEINTWLRDLFAISIGSLSIIIVKSINKIFNERREERKQAAEQMERRITIIETGLGSLLHDRLYSLTDSYIRQGYVTLEDLENLDYIYRAYNARSDGGNGQRRYELVMKLPIVESYEGVIENEKCKLENQNQK